MAKRKSRSIKRKTPVDAALEIARNAIPKKPVATKGKRTVPAALDWGNGIPLDKLAYLNDDEMALVQAKRIFKEPRSYDGIPAFPDPGDTAAGDTGQGTSSSEGLGNNVSTGNTDSSDVGSTQSSDNQATTTSTGNDVGSVQSSNDTGATSTSPSGTTAAGTSSTSAGDTKTTTTGPSTGPTDQPARSETSYSQPATTAPVSSPTGSLQGPGGYDPTSTAPSTEATNAALNRIAEGSNVINSPYSYDPGLQKIPDRIAPVNYGQQPTVDMPDTTGAPSPLSDPTLNQYDRNAYDTGLSPSQVAAINAANQAALDARYVGSDLDAPVPGSGLTPPSYSDPSMVGPAPRETSLISAREPTDYVGPTTQQAALSQPTVPPNYSNPPVYNPNYPPAPTTTPVVPDAMIARIVAGETPPRAIGALPQGYAQTGRVINIADSNLGMPVSDIGANVSEVSASPAYATNPYYSSPAQQAADVRRTIALAQGPAVAPTEINIPGGDLSVSPAQQQAAIDNAVRIASSGPPTRGLLQPQGQSPDVVAAGVAPEETTGEFDYDPAQDPANYVQPVYPGDESGPGYFTPEERQAYLDSIQGTRSSERIPEYVPQTTRPDDTNKEDKPNKKPRPIRKPRPYRPHDYTYNNYANLGAGNGVDPDIVAFNQYNQNLNRGGRIGDSVEAALRIAKSKLL